MTYESSSEKRNSPLISRPFECATPSSLPIHKPATRRASNAITTRVVLLFVRSSVAKDREKYIIITIVNGNVRYTSIFIGSVNRASDTRPSVRPVKKINEEYNNRHNRNAHRPINNTVKYATPFSFGSRRNLMASYASTPSNFGSFIQASLQNLAM